MAYFEGLSKSQFEATHDLNQFLVTHQIGKVSIARAFPFHGKIQYFSSAEGEDTFLLGSSNLSNIVPLKGITRRNYEVDIEISDTNTCKEINNLLHGLFVDASTPFDDIFGEIQIKENQNSLLSSRSDVQEVGSEKMARIAKNIADGAMSFLKAEYKILAIFVAAVAILLFFRC